MYNIPGFKLRKIIYLDKRTGYLEYSAPFCRLFIIRDMLGTQICNNGVFFGPMDFSSIGDAWSWLSSDKIRYESAKRVFRKVWFRHLLWEVWEVGYRVRKVKRILYRFL